MDKNNRKAPTIDDYLGQRGHKSKGLHPEEDLLLKEAREISNLSYEGFHDIFEVYQAVAQTIEDSLGQKYSISRAIEEFPILKIDGTDYLILTCCAKGFIDHHFPTGDLNYLSNEMDEVEKTYLMDLVEEGFLNIQPVKSDKGLKISVLSYCEPDDFLKEEDYQTEDNNNLEYKCDEIDVVPFSDLPERDIAYLDKVGGEGHIVVKEDVVLDSYSDDPTEISVGSAVEVSFSDLKDEDRAYLNNECDGRYRDNQFDGSQMSAEAMHNLPNEAELIRQEEEQEDKELFD